MTFQDWKKDTKQRINKDGLSGIKRSFYELAFGGIRRIDRRVSFGTPIYEKDWDVLLILDACRADLMREVADKYSFTNNNAVTSVAGGSRSWMVRNFDSKYRSEMQETVYVTGNPFSKEVMNGKSFHNMEEVWTYAWDDELNTVPARAITDVAIHEYRLQKPNRMIVHYMQPHHPFVPNPMDSGMNKTNLKNPDRPIWQKVKDGEVDKEKVWREYRNNLQYVLDDVALLLDNLNADDVVISADHGNAVGEFGFYGHGDVPIPAIRRVPWCRTTAEDTGEYEPTLEPTNDDYNVEDKLADLGYL